MRRDLVLLLVTVVALCFAPAAFAQNTVSASATGATNPQLTITLTANLVPVTTLIISGNPTDPQTTFTTATPGSGATIAYGNVDSQCTQGSTAAGQCHTLTDGTGARVVSTVEVQVVTPGATFTAGLESGGSAAVTEYYKVCTGGACPTEAADTDWEDPTAANLTPIPTLGGSTGLELTPAAVPSGTTIEAQIGFGFDNVTTGAINVPVLFTAIRI